MQKATVVSVDEQDTLGGAITKVMSMVGEPFSMLFYPLARNHCYSAKE